MADRGDRVEAAEQLRAAHRCSGRPRCAAAPRADRTAGGTRARSHSRRRSSPVAVEASAADPLGAYDLTPREVEVLRLVAQGRTNRQIAEELFISESTAGVHVSHIIGKLGVGGRVEAATIATRLGLMD